MRPERSKHVKQEILQNRTEKERGISVTSSVMQFDYAGKRVNILDTPGHEDFSEDTYRTLMAVDAAVMVIDSAKGIEAQTKKLFQVVKRRGIPVYFGYRFCAYELANRYGEKLPRAL